jgi:hypothetical protein
MYEAQHFARHVIRVRVFVRAETDAQVAGLADVKKPVRIVEHQINPGTLWKGLEEIGAEPRKQRFWMIKQSKLSLRHCAIELDSRTTRQYVYPPW